MENNLTPVLKNESVCKLEPDVLTLIIIKEYTRITTMKGRETNKEETRVVVAELSRILLEKMPGITIEEFSNVMREGVLGEYGDNYISVANIYNWLKTYQAEKARIRRAKQATIDQEEKIHTKEQFANLVSQMRNRPALSHLFEKLDNNNYKSERNEHNKN